MIIAGSAVREWRLGDFKKAAEAAGIHGESANGIRKAQPGPPTTGPAGAAHVEERS